ncbi:MULTISPECIES: SAM-dependent methyltransferase [Arthrobacter]|uniref:SAM-dependent methyltransferase n=3 Tax=Arthrobacter TaxID=1663 RepID=A0ABU9KII1_9MICC|nr:SAM-dependent methyltransferase [Arthrobacter sp. YJM1]MDP5225961.1 SAM-dependent methyltransferase [Arthrobacter sp. YJM1]
MATSRSSFLERGHYQSLVTAMAEVLRRRLPRPLAESVLLDAGAGTGYYLHALCAALAAGTPAPGDGPGAVAFDISKFALRRAARLNPDAAVFVWDVWKPFPLQDASVDALTVVFAPRNPAEFHRVLRADGSVLVVTPQPGHLREIAGPAGLLDIEEGKLDRLDAGMGSHFTLAERHSVDAGLRLSRDDVAAVTLMGPAGHHQSLEQLRERVAGLPDATPVTASFTLSVFAPRPGPATDS